jgi:hypothetical protein
MLEDKEGRRTKDVVGQKMLQDRHCRSMREARPGPDAAQSALTLRSGTIKARLDDFDPIPCCLS